MPSSSTCSRLRRGASSIPRTHSCVSTSDLTASGSLTRDRLVAPYVFYNALVAAFAVALYLESRRSVLFKVGLAALLLNSLAGVFMVTIFPEDLGRSLVTVFGTGHLVFAGVSVLCTIAIAFVHGVAFRRASKALSTISFAIGVAILVFGPLAVFATAAESDPAGLAERIPIALFLGWVATVSAYAFRVGGQTDDLSHYLVATARA